MILLLSVTWLSLGWWHREGCGFHSTYCRSTHQVTCGQQWLFLINLIKDLQLMCCFHCSLCFF